MAIDADIISLYYALKPGEIDLRQLGNDDQLPALSAPPREALRALSGDVNLEDRQGRYAANLGYTLGVRVLADDDSVSAELHSLGANVLARVGVADPDSGERDLRAALRRLTQDPEPQLTDDIVNALLDAFKGALDADFDAAAATWRFTGPAAETATMFCELGSMIFDCRGREGHVRVGNQNVPVTVIEYEICTQSPFARTAPGVDPRNWTTYNPFFFDSVDLLTPPPAANAANWHGVIQETVGALLSGNPTTTNLAVSYVEQPGLAAVSYDLAPKSPALKDDDNTVTVDYGLFAVMDEGIHRRVRMLKVVHIDGHEGSHHEWLCPFWAHQMSMIGWWF